MSLETTEALFRKEMTLRNNSEPEAAFLGVVDGYKASSCGSQIFILY